MRQPFPHSESGAFWLGVSLIASSFAIYPVYAVILLVPLPLSVRIGAAIVASIISWGVFFAGSILAGRRGVDYVKRWFTRAALPPPPSLSDPADPAEKTDPSTSHRES